MPGGIHLRQCMASCQSIVRSNGRGDKFNIGRTKIGLGDDYMKWRQYKSQQIVSFQLGGQMGDSGLVGFKC